MDEGMRVVNEGIAVFEETQARLSGQIERITKAVEDIRAQCVAEGVVTPALNEAIRKSYNLTIYYVKLNKYLSDIKDDTKPLEQRVAILSVMTQLYKTIETVDEL